LPFVTDGIALAIEEIVETEQNEISMRKVLEHFLRVESNAPKYAARKAEFEHWISKSNWEFFQHVRVFADSRDDVHPLLTWTVGTRDNKHHERVRRWISARVRLGRLYSCAISDEVKADLDECRGNLTLFSDRAWKYPEFRMDTVPQGDLAIIVAISHTVPSRSGTEEVVDGVHRAVAMIANGVEDTWAYIAELRP
jgi:hypothetical protein